MPDFYVDEISIEPSEYVNACSKRELIELIEVLVEEGKLPRTVLKQDVQSKSYSRLQDEFSLKLGKLVEKYHSISKEDEEKLEQIFKKYL